MYEWMSDSLMSLQEILKNYEQRKRMREKDGQRLKGELERVIEQSSIQALKLQNHKVNQIHKNQQAIEAKMRKQQELLTSFRRSEEDWGALYEQLNRALMQVGDLTHYSGYIEAQIDELLGIGSVAKFLEQADKQETQQTKKTERQASEIIPQQPIVRQTTKVEKIYEQITDSEPLEGDK